MRIPMPTNIGDAAVNGYDHFVRGGVLDGERTPSTIVEAGAQRTVRRYEQPEPGAVQATPVLLVPPLAAPARCFDLRPGCSMAEYLVTLGYPTYLVDYGLISFGDRGLGLEHWFEDVIPRAAETVLADSGADSVHLVGWCLGGIMSLLAVAAGRVQARSVAMVASPFDFAQVRVVAPIRQAAQVTGGRVVSSIYRLMGGAPAPLVKLGFQLSSLDKYVTKPLAIWANLHDRDFLAQIEAVDEFTDNMIAYPGRTFGQLYHRFFRANDLYDGRLELSDGAVDLAEVRVPVLSVAGTGDTLAPEAAVLHVEQLLPNSPQVRLESAPGGHLGVLTGRKAEGTTWKHIDEFLLENDGGVAHGADRTATADRPGGQFSRYR